ncbi:MAG: YHYH protein, partial [Tepidisphaeraceae bacterium]
GNTPTGYTLAGNATYQYLGDVRKDASSNGVALHATRGGGGSVAQVVSIPRGAGQAYRFDFRGLAQDGLALASGGHLYMRVDFLGDQGKTYDAKEYDFFPVIEQARHDLAVNGNDHRSGAAVWRTYSMEFSIPFPEITRLKLSVNLDKALARGSASDFYVDDFDLAPLSAEAKTEPTPSAAHGQTVSLDHLLPIGGRWFYAAAPGESRVPGQFDYRNADRLLYFDGQYEAPFAGNMSSWLRAGDKDLTGHVVSTDQFVPDNEIVTLDKTALVIHTHGLPNHPTGKYPSEGRGLLGNPNYITEQNETYYIPLNPQERQGHTYTDTTNTNHALKMGPIGIAANGVVFYNPFDANSQDASSFMDACCGHPDQRGLYHYHKYPICVNTPWQDAGEAHSPVLGWAFDGYPIYGPYESKDVMAKDLTGDNKLNGFNMHYDAQRGWHYHVTPGVFPYIIGGFWGTLDPRDNQRPPRSNGQRGMGGPGMGGPGMGGPNMGGPGMRRRGNAPDGPPPGF